MNIHRNLISLAEKTIANFSVPKSIKKNFTEINNDKALELKECLRYNLYRDVETSFLESEEGKRDMENQLIKRLDYDRHSVIPWLDSAKPIKNARILEIGCGTGSSTVALAEQGANVVGVDVDADSLAVAKKRCELHGVNAQFIECNATEIASKLSGSDFDFIIFFASLEHMTIQERLISIKKTWEMLKPGNIWAVIDTPNRLWYYDSHTSLLPFYYWLPDDIAYDYASFSKRYEFNELPDSVPKDLVKLSRWGRGVSYHELELTMGPIESLDIISNLSDFGIYGKCQYIYELLASKGLNRKYEKILKKIMPNINPAFTKPYLNLMIRKN
ncbi:MAG: class I SAM-dependent methyltransferase [Methanosarcina flavescens]|jgi:2-polyprenyl-3-methyl-5-hydroxy-6-metoxy-1,4-benzoquinol methylase|nr:class I SAM-dependent methyltransferase [Methanosarcina thermophila]BAW30196.1 conserved hypothetical protein [Methanosarcina thermophila]BAW30701.1 conserved hypothetical protein [Methanosarcina thermophila]